MAVEEPPSELVELLLVEQERRWHKGQGVIVETYFAIHPKILADETSALQMIYNEVLLREEAGESPRLEEYVRRFPQYRDQLAPLFEVHRARIGRVTWCPCRPEIAGRNDIRNQ